jgi:hypothetical protein
MKRKVMKANVTVNLTNNAAPIKVKDLKEAKTSFVNSSMSDIDVY